MLSPPDLRDASDLLIQLAKTRPAAPMTPLNRGLGPNRRYATVSTPLARIKSTAKRIGATVNDVLLVAVTGMLSRTLDLADDVVALVPVSVRREGDEGGNRISTVLVDLPVWLPDPIDRLNVVHEAMSEL